jgi:hypothetical protein
VSPGPAIGRSRDEEGEGAHKANVLSSSACAVINRNQLHSAANFARRNFWLASTNLSFRFGGSTSIGVTAFAEMPFRAAMNLLKPMSLQAVDKLGA